MTTAADRRRLGDGKRAMALKEPRSAAAMRAQIESLDDAVLAMQSLDDLGSPEANNLADAGMMELQRRRGRLERLLERKGRVRT